MAERAERRVRALLVVLCPVRLAEGRDVAPQVPCVPGEGRGRAVRRAVAREALAVVVELGGRVVALRVVSTRALPSV